MNQSWFEMRDVRRRFLDGAVWIPLRAVSHLRDIGRPGYVGFEEEFFGVGTLAVPMGAMPEARELGWHEVGIGHDHRPFIENGVFVPSDAYVPASKRYEGVHLVLDQHLNRDEPNEWHLHQDLVLGLGLKREDDQWLCPGEGYAVVARLTRRPDGNPSSLEFRAEHLKDYLCARGMALCATSYRSRRVITEEAGIVDWPEGSAAERSETDRWEGRVTQIHEGGIFSEGVHVVRTARTDIGPEDDVPTVGPTDPNIVSESYTIEPSGKQVFAISGELWRSEWVMPGPISPRVAGDEVEPDVTYIIDAPGSRKKATALRDAGRWLWFKPQVINALSNRRGGGLSWHTRDTGSVWCSPDMEVHFGINELGLVNTFAKDVALLPDWQQKVWAAFNVGPGGGVSDELLASQVRVDPAPTQAPEEFLLDGIQELNSTSFEKLGFALFLPHEKAREIASRCTRFRATENDGLFALAKDLARLTADSLDRGALHAYLRLPKGDALGSLKSLERLLATRTTPEHARALLTPLVGIYDLRLADAHLPTSEIADALRIARVDPDAPQVRQGWQLLNSCVSALYGILDELRAWPAEA